MARVLVACEFSGVVRDAFTAKGHEALSCDILPTEVEGPHYQGDVRDILEQGWDVMIAHPPCTYLCNSGMHWNRRRPERMIKTEEALAFVKDLMRSSIPRWAIENPHGRINTAIRKPDQVLQPYNFGHDASKATALWLHGLPALQATQYIPPRKVGHLKRWSNQMDSGQNKLGPSKERAAIRSRTYEGIARAMAEQWDSLLRTPA